MSNNDQKKMDERNKKKTHKNCLRFPVKPMSMRLCQMQGFDYIEISYTWTYMR